MEKFTLLIMPLNEGNFEEYKTDILPNLKNIADEYIQLFPGVFLFRTSSSSAVIHYFEYLFCFSTSRHASSQCSRVKRDASTSERFWF
jgi:hypothetical protein